MFGEAGFMFRWRPHVEAIEKGLREGRRSSRIGAMPNLFREDGEPRHIDIQLDVHWNTTGRGVEDLVLRPASSPKSKFRVIGGDDKYIVRETGLLLVGGARTISMDGVALLLKPGGHSVEMTLLGDAGFESKITLMLETASLGPVLAESTLARAAERNMTAAEVLRESASFSGASGRPIVVAAASSQPSIELYFDNAQPDRDAAWRASLRIVERFLLSSATPEMVTHVTHAPFMVAQVLPPQFDPESGTILAQWNSDDPDGAQWRFAVDTVSLRLMAQAIGESMVRGKRFSDNPEVQPGLEQDKPVNSRFSRATEITVRPSRAVRRYTVHPGDILSILRDAQLQRLVSEMAYPLEFTYQRTPESKRDVVISELGQWLGAPAISLPSEADLERALGESMSGTLAKWFLGGRHQGQKTDLQQRYAVQRGRHLANRASFHHRIAHFRLVDALYPERKLDLEEGLSARLRSRTRGNTPGEGAAPAYPLPFGITLNAQSAAMVQNFVPDAAADIDQARRMPIGLVNMIEFSSELVGVLSVPQASQVRLTDLSLSVLGATGAMKAAFDEGRTVFEVEATDGQLTRSIKTRVGRIGVAWNRAVHVIVYERSTAPGAQFASEQLKMLGRPLMRKMHEYIDILEPQRLFASEATAPANSSGCLHSFSFASKRIYVNGAWGRDLDGEGYEIPLFNPNDQSGFYSKPWFGPVAESGSNDLVRHWHEHPEDMVFYTSTVRGAGADTDAWPAVAGVDLDRHPSFSSIATPARAPARDNLAFKTMPSYTLAAADNPRFAMRVSPDGPSNIMHGRNVEKLVAPLRTIQIERTGAKSRLAFDATGPLATLVASAEPLWQSAKAAAEVKSIETTIARISRDAGALLDAFGKPDNINAACSVLKGKLKAKIDASFQEAYSRMDVPLNTALAAIDTTAIDELVKKQQAQILHALSSNIGVPIPLLDAACSHAERVIGAMRTRIGELEDIVTGPASASARILAQLDDDNLAIGLRGMFSRAAAALDGPAGLATQASDALKRLREELDRAWHELQAKTDELFAKLVAIRDGAPDLLHADALAWLDKAPEEIGKTLAQFDTVLGSLRKAKVPEAMPALRNAHESCIRALLRGRALLAEQKQTLAAARAAVAALDATAHAAIRTALDASVLKPYVAWKSNIDGAVATAKGFVVAIEADLDEAWKALARHKADIEACTFATEIDGKLDEIRAIIAAGAGSLVEAKAKLDAALLALLAKVRSTSADIDNEIVKVHRQAVAQAREAMEMITKGMVAGLKELQTGLRDVLTGSADTMRKALDAEKLAIHSSIDALDCTAWDAFRDALNKKVDALVNDARDQLADAAASMLDDDTRRRMAALKADIDAKIATAGAELKSAYDAIAPKAGQAVKLVKLLSEPPELPHITINTSNLECVFDDVKAQIETSPFVARLREGEACLAELGIANPCRALGAGMITDNIDGAYFNDIVKDLALKFDNFFKAFRMPSFPSDAIKFSHHIDEKKRRAEAKAEIHHQFSSTEQLFSIAAFSLDIRKPKIDASSNFEIAENEAGKARTNATFGGDWILNFGGQMLVEFQAAEVQFSDTSGFNFKLDAKNVKMAKSLEFIANVFKAMMPDLPETVQITKDSKGMPIGARIEQNNAIGPFDFGALYIGETVLGSGFGLLVEQGSMKIDTSFKIGDTASPVFMQIGIYGGGGWLKARAFADVVDGRLELGYAASIGVSLGSARAFTLASVASGTYSIRMFVEATFQSKGGNSFIAGISMNGSARILGYLNAYLMLLLQVEHKEGAMSGSGKLDVEIEVCWCYSVRVSRTVQQNM